MNFFLSISPEQYQDKIIKTEGFLETLLFGGQMLLLGMATVFSVLCLIWAALVIFERVFHKEAKKAPKTESAPVVVSEPASASDDGEIIAVIAAAIAMAESESNGSKFRVVSFRKK
jgi:sodium pump decarboxylase gamma subunit